VLTFVFKVKDTCEVRESLVWENDLPGFGVVEVREQKMYVQLTQPYLVPSWCDMITSKKTGIKNSLK